MTSWEVGETEGYFPEAVLLTVTLQMSRNQVGACGGSADSPDFGGSGDEQEHLRGLQLDNFGSKIQMGWNRPLCM